MVTHMLQNIDWDMGNTIPRPQSLWTTFWIWPKCVWPRDTKTYGTLLGHWTDDWRHILVPYTLLVAYMSWCPKMSSQQGDMVSRRLHLRMVTIMHPAMESRHIMHQCVVLHAYNKCVKLQSNAIHNTHLAKRNSRHTSSKKLFVTLAFKLKSPKLYKCWYL